MNCKIDSSCGGCGRRLGFWIDLWSYGDEVVWRKGMEVRSSEAARIDDEIASGSPPMPTIARTQLQVWFIRVCSSIVLWTWLVHLVAICELWHPHLLARITSRILSSVELNVDEEFLFVSKTATFEIPGQFWAWNDISCICCIVWLPRKWEKIEKKRKYFFIWIFNIITDVDVHVEFFNPKNEG